MAPQWGRGGHINYFDIFIAVAPDCAARVGTVPPERAGKKTIAGMEHELIAGQPYVLTQEDVQFAVHVRRLGLRATELKPRRAQLWAEFFAKPMACMRASPLPKSYGWGLHFNDAGKVALVPVESPRYQELLNDNAVQQTRAMRAQRA